MFPSGQDPYDPDAGQGGIPSQRGMPGIEPHLEALRPDAPMPGRVSTVRTLMFIGGVCGILLALLFGMGLAAPTEAMNEALDEQAALAAEQGVAWSVDADLMRSLMVSMALVTGVYGALSTFLASRLRNRTVGVFWGVVLFQGLAGLILLWSLLSGEVLSIVPLGFAVTMICFMWAKESRAYYGLL
ncbi:hypothetical protein GCM10007079_12900 [Nocardiopsis terrae]|nr:hypothetical protein [Nocardiopsis terrae]GHC76523.1 hypothetical protein GCM10007079_12900 [Nocardiopsis terrae]